MNEIEKHRLKLYEQCVNQYFVDKDPQAAVKARSVVAGIFRDMAETEGDMLRSRALYLAAEMMDIHAERTAFMTGVPTNMPDRARQLLFLGCCEACGRPWQVNATGACQVCPTIIYGARACTQAEQEQYPTRPVKQTDFTVGWVPS